MIFEICILTYNRSVFDSYRSIIESINQVKASNDHVLIKLRVFDNGSEPLMAENLKKFTEEESISYTRVEKNLHFHGGFREILSSSSSDYILVMGNGDKLKLSAISDILHFLDINVIDHLLLGVEFKQDSNYIFKKANSGETLVRNSILKSGPFTNVALVSANVFNTKSIRKYYEENIIVTGDDEINPYGYFFYWLDWIFLIRSAQLSTCQITQECDTSWSRSLDSSIILASCFNCFKKFTSKNNINKNIKLKWFEYGSNGEMIDIYTWFDSIFNNIVSDNIYHRHNFFRSSSGEIPLLRIGYSKYFTKIVILKSSIAIKISEFLCEILCRLIPGVQNFFK